MSDFTVASAVGRTRVASPLLLGLGVAMVAGLIWLLVAWLGAINRDYLVVALTVVDPVSGEVVRTWETGATERPVFGDEVVVLHTGGGLVAYLPDGEVAWRYSAGSARAQVADGMVIVDTFDRRSGQSVVALDEATGAERWHHDGMWADQVGDGVAVLDSVDGVRVVELESGTVWAELDRARDALLDDGAAVLLNGQALTMVTSRGAHTLASDVPGADLVAFAEGVVVVRQVTDSPLRPRPRVLTAYDAEGGVLWEHDAPRYTSVEVDAAKVRLWTEEGAVEIALATGSVRATDGSPAAAPLVTVAGEATDSEVYHASSVLSAAGVDYYVVESPDGSSVRSTFAVEAATGAVLWTYPAGAVVAGDRVAVLAHEHDRYVVIDDLGEVLAEIDKDGPISAAVAGDPVVLTGDTLISIDRSGEQRVIAARLPARSRIAGADGDTVVVRTQVQTDRGVRILLTAYDVSSGDRAWRRRVRQYRSAGVDDGRLVLTSARSVIELDLASGDEVAHSEPRPEEDEEPPTPLVAFDRTRGEFLWQRDDLRAAEVGHLAGEVIVVTVERLPLE